MQLLCFKLIELLSHIVRSYEGKTFQFSGKIKFKSFEFHEDFEFEFMKAVIENESFLNFLTKFTDISTIILDFQFDKFGQM